MTRAEARELLQSLTDLAPTGYRVAAMLCLHTNGVNDCWVTVETLMQETGGSRRQVQRSLRVLEMRDVLVTTQRQGQSNVYTIAPLGGGRHLGDAGDTQVTPRSEKPPTLLSPGDHSTATSPAHAQGASSVVAAYVDEASRCGILLDPRSAPRIGRDAKQLLGTFTIDQLQEAARVVARKKLSPSTLGQVAQNGEYKSKRKDAQAALERKVFDE